MTASQLSIMCAMKKYFRYVSHRCVCCFPFIVIEGIKQDWESILQKLDFIKQFDLESWVDTLKPIIGKIIDSYDGKIDKEFWKNMLHIVDSRGAYNPGYTDGWFTNFFLYNQYGSQVAGCISSKTKLSSEILAIPFVFDDNGKITNCEFLTGFFGATQDPKNSSIKPVIGWAVRELDDDENPKKIGLNDKES